MNHTDFIFRELSDFAEVPGHTFLIFKKDDWTIPIAHIICSEANYKVKATPDLKLGEQLALYDACEQFYRENYGEPTEF